MEAFDELRGRPLVKLEGGDPELRGQALVQRCVQLHEGGSSAESILLSAPTSIACDRLRQQIERALPASEASWAGRVSILRPLEVCSAIVEEAHGKGLTSRRGRVLTPEEYLFFLEDLKTLGQKNQRLHGMLDFFYAQWSNLEAEQDWLLAGEEAGVVRLMRQLLDLYEAGLRHEVPFIAAQLMQLPQNASLRGRYRHVLCNDFQNLSHAEQTVLALSTTEQLMVAGDAALTTEAATVYPNPRGFAAFERLRRGVAVVDLGDGERTGGANVEMHRWNSPAEEEARLAEMLKPQLQVPSQGEGALAVAAVPTVFWGRRTARALEAGGIAVSRAGLGHRLGGDPRRPGCHRALSAYAGLLLVANPHDPLAWRLWGGFDHALTHSDLWREARRVANEADGKLPEALSAMAKGEGTFARSAGEIAQGAQQLLTATEGLTGSQLLEALGARPEDALWEALAPIAPGETALELRDRARAQLLSPHLPKDGQVLVALYEQVAGLSPDIVLLPGLVEGLVPRREAFDIVKSPEYRAKLTNRENARLRTALAHGKRHIGSSFAKADAELAERAKMRVMRIASEHGRRVALLQPTKLPEGEWGRQREEGAETPEPAAFPNI